MAPEAPIRQREVVGQRIAFSDGERSTKYTLPFVDASWTVAFIVFDLIGSAPKVLRATVHAGQGRLQTPVPAEELKAVESVPLERFASLVHFDPWWAFRGVSGVHRDWIEAIFATNIARSFRHQGKAAKVHDLLFSDGFVHLEGLLAKDDLFRGIMLRHGEIDLLSLKRKQPERPHAEAATAAKAL